MTLAVGAVGTGKTDNPFLNKKKEQQPAESYGSVAYMPPIFGGQGGETSTGFNAKAEGLDIRV